MYVFDLGSVREILIRINFAITLILVLPQLVSYNCPEISFFLCYHCCYHLLYYHCLDRSSKDQKCHRPEPGMVVHAYSPSNLGD